MIRSSTRNATAPLGGLALLLTGLFSLRVLGQALQRWWPQSFLPPAAAFQGSHLPYPLLFFVQLVILAAMLYAAQGIRRGTIARSRRWAVLFGSAGAVYLLVALTRIAIGLFVPGADPWFRAWIPAFFHVVLAAFVLTVARYHAGKGGSG